MTRRVIATVVALAGLGLMGGCGVSVDRQPRTIAADKVPYQLLEQAPTTTSSTTPLAVPSIDVPVYYVLNGRLVEVPRQVTQSPSVTKAVIALLLGPGPDEEAAGLRTAITPTITIEVGTLEQGVVTMDLSSDFSKLPRDEQQLALAQLVWTATGIGGVTGALFTLDGKNIEVVLPDATLATGPVGREAFAALGPGAPSP